MQAIMADKYGKNLSTLVALAKNVSKFRRGVKKVPKAVASLARGGPCSALLTDASRAAGVRLVFADF